ncbi:MAG: glycosyltransferase family 4 protein [Armatimonadetes bacterium]|nr:glycosyltransferase family 4 protein [Armatimonadota bacterium]
MTKTGGPGDETPALLALPGKDQAMIGTRYPLRVVAVVNNPAIHDTRVIKQAEGLAAAGHDVTVLAHAQTGVPDDEVVRGVRYVRRSARYSIGLLPAVLRCALGRGNGRPAVARAMLAMAAIAALIQWPFYLVDICIRHRLKYKWLIYRMPKRSAAALRRLVRRAIRRAVAWATAMARALLPRSIGRPLRRALGQVVGMVRRGAAAFARLLRVMYRVDMTIAAVDSSDGPLISRLVRWLARTNHRILVAPMVWTYLPGIIYEEARAYRPDVICALEPDVIHAHDLYTLGAAAVAAERLGVPFIYDAHELERHGSDIRSPLGRFLVALEEGSYISGTRAVVTVSPSIAEHLQQLYRIPRPLVVLNAPKVGSERAAGRDVRADIGLGPQTPLLLYVGKVTTGRGMEELAESLAYAPGFHLATVGPQVPEVVASMRRVARRHDVESRLAIMDPVAPEDVVSYVATADVGIIVAPNACLSYAYSLPNKLFETSLAGLPLVVSDLVEMRRFVISNRIGQVLPSDAPRDIARTVMAVYRDREKYRPSPERRAKLAAEYGWDAQMRKLIALYDAIGEEVAAKRFDRQKSGRDSVLDTVTDKGKTVSSSLSAR